MREVFDEGQAVDRLTEAFGVPLPILRPPVTASAVGHLVEAGLLVCLGGAPSTSSTVGTPPTRRCTAPDDAA
ncbi:hypothetical protein ACFCYI_12400 [Streptomyces sp. NPDC056257]|uniref:hypothetical protein n=1 Tax=Streptomyces sp. NPDC056257 TaxID=3345765 RepID=UPI0035D939A5